MNTVIKKDVNEGQIVPMVRALDLKHPCSLSNTWMLEPRMMNLDHVVTAESMRDLLNDEFGSLQQISHFTKVMLQRCITKEGWK